MEKSHRSQGGTMHHCSTVEQKVQWISQLLVPEPTHGLLSQLSRTHDVSRQTLYRWKEKGAQALEAALEIRQNPPKRTMQVQEQVLTLLIEAHASYRDIQACLMKVCGIRMSLGSISRIVQEAGKRAQQWLSQQQASTPRALALDEQYSSQRGKAYLNVIDVHSGQVWATLPPVAVDGESWTLVWWYLGEQGLLCERSVSDGGRAIQEALGQVQRLDSHQRDVWHVLHVASQVQGRCDRALQQLQDRLPIIQRQAERVALGKKARGRVPSANVAEHEKRIQQARYVVEAIRYLSQELRNLLEVVVLGHAGIVSSRDRKLELEALLALLEDVREQALPPLQKEFVSLSKHLRLALPHLLLFAADLDEPQQQADERLGPDAVRLIAWAWQRRALLGPTIKDLLAGLDPTWREEAQALLHVWEHTVRASSAVENWHSILRPHLAVHRTLSAGMLALLAVSHNHQVAPRGVHEGLSPLQRTGTLQPETDWLLALGYSRQAA
jgi:transposase-like protein